MTGQPRLPVLAGLTGGPDPERAGPGQPRQPGKIPAGPRQQVSAEKDWVRAAGQRPQRRT